MFDTGIVLRITDCEQRRLIVWDETRGKISLRIVGKIPGRVTQGALVIYQAHIYRQQWHTKTCNLQHIPASWAAQDINFLHTFLTIAQRTLNWHEPQVALFAWSQWLYAEQIPSQFHKKILLADFLYKSGLYPEDEQLGLLIGLISQNTNITLEGSLAHDFEKIIDDWIAQCIQALPEHIGAV